MELKGVVVEYLKESKKALSLVDLFNILFVKDLISLKDRDVLEMGDLRTICAELVKDGVLVQKGAGKYAYNSDYKGETPQIKEEAPQIKGEALQIIREAPQIKVEAPQVKVEAPQIKIEAPQKTTGTEPSLYTSLPPEEPNALDMMWKYAEYKTNKKLEAADMFNFYAEGKNKEGLAKIMDDFIDYFKIEKNKENLAKWEHHFSNALLIQDVITKWD